MAKLVLNNIRLQYIFLSRVNQKSNKYSFDCIIPMSDPQAQKVIDTCNAEWEDNQRKGGICSPQSMGYQVHKIDAINKFNDKVKPFLDPTQEYLIIKGTQPNGTKYPTKIYDGGDAEGVVREHPYLAGVIGENTIANVELNITHYTQQVQGGSRGVKAWGNWIQIVELVESEYSMNSVPDPVADGVPGFQVPEELKQKAIEMEEAEKKREEEALAQQQVPEIPQMQGAQVPQQGVQQTQQTQQPLMQQTQQPVMEAPQQPTQPTIPQMEVPETESARSQQGSVIAF